MKRPREAILTGQPRQKRELERERRLAAAEERTRIVRDLHDSAAHAINVILVHAGGARLIQERDPAAVAHALSTIEDVARETIGEIGRLIRNRRAEGQPTARSRVRPGSSRYRHSPSVTRRRKAHHDACGRPLPATLARGRSGRIQGSEPILGVFNSDPTQAIASFGNLAASDVEIACFGRGAPVPGDARAQLEQVAARL